MLKIDDKLIYVGANDTSSTLFENLYPIDNGMRYNSYLITAGKTALMDTVDASVEKEFMQKLKEGLKDRTLDYLVVQHMEPDHSSLIGEVLRLYENAKLVINEKALGFLKQFSGKDYAARAVIVKDGDELDLCGARLKFIFAAMVHWPEVMVSFESESKTLFSADAFGSFGTSPELFSDSIECDEDWTGEARRYYSNIVGKFGTQVAALLKKASALDIRRICPLHGTIWNENVAFPLKKYETWSSYKPEKEGVVVAYGSMYGNTKQAAELLCEKLAQKGMEVKAFDVSYTKTSEIVSNAFKYSKIVFACPTYYGAMFPKMEELLNDLKRDNLRGRKVAFIENGTWTPTTAKLMKEAVLSMKDMTIIEPFVTVRSALDESALNKLDELANAVANA